MYANHHSLLRINEYLVVTVRPERVVSEPSKAPSSDPFACIEPAAIAQEIDDAAAREAARRGECRQRPAEQRCFARVD